MATTFDVKPFAFDRIFADAPPEPPKEQKHRRSTDARDLAMEVDRLRAQLDALRDAQQDELARTRTEAFEAGLVHARTERDNAILSSIDALQASLETIADQYDDLKAEVVCEAGQLALAGAEALAGHAIEQEPGRAIDEAIGRALEQVTRGQEIEVRVHPDLEEEIQRRVDERQNADRRRLFLTVTADPAITPGDAVLTWERGGVVLDAARRRQVIESELAPLIISRAA